MRPCSTFALKLQLLFHNFCACEPKPMSFFIAFCFLLFALFAVFRKAERHLNASSRQAPRPLPLTSSPSALCSLPFAFCRLLLALCLLPFAFLTSCSDGGRRDIEAYYFPVKALRKGQVYEYAVSNKDSISLEYWYYRGFVRDSGLFLSGTFYDQNFEIGQIVREKITKSGAIAKEYNLYEPASETEQGQTQIQTNIESPNLFPFSVRDSSGIFEFKLHFTPPDDPETVIYLNRKRRYVGNVSDFEFNGESYPCIRFAFYESISSQKEGRPDLETFGEERYAKGLGLVYYSKSYGKDAFKVEGRLTDIFSMGELEQRAATRFRE